MSETIITTHEALNRYETLYFQPRQKNHGISVILPLLITVAQECFMVNIFFSAISQLRLVGSHNTNLGVLVQGALELDVLPFGRCHFFSDLVGFDISSKKKCL